MTHALTELREFDRSAEDCFCCGLRAPESAVVRLASHQEVRICFACVDWLDLQRGQARRPDSAPRSPATDRDARDTLRARFAHAIRRLRGSTRTHPTGPRAAESPGDRVTRRSARPGPRAVAILKTTDMAATVAWYHLAGFDIRSERRATARHSWCEVERDGRVLQFLASDQPLWPGPPSFTGCFYVRPPSVRDVFDQLRSRLEIPWGVEERPWGARELVLRDPNGYYITFTERP